MYEKETPRDPLHSVFVAAWIHRYNISCLVEPFLTFCFERRCLGHPIASYYLATVGGSLHFVLYATALYPCI